jgi:hypothetical protein
MKPENLFADYIDNEGLAEIQALEKELGNTLIAFSTPPQPANLSDDKLARIKELEKKLCVRLVAYQQH